MSFKVAGLVDSYCNPRMLGRGQTGLHSETCSQRKENGNFYLVSLSDLVWFSSELILIKATLELTM